MIAQEVWNAWLSVAIVLMGGGVPYVAYLRATPTDPELDGFGAEALSVGPLFGTCASEDK